MARRLGVCNTWGLAHSEECARDDRGGASLLPQPWAPVLTRWHGGAGALTRLGQSGAEIEGISLLEPDIRVLPQMNSLLPACNGVLCLRNYFQVADSDLLPFSAIPAPQSLNLPPSCCAARPELPAVCCRFALL